MAEPKVPVAIIRNHGRLYVPKEHRRPFVFQEEMMDTKVKKSFWEKPSLPYLLIIAFLLVMVIVGPLLGAGTLQDRNSGGFANTQYQTYTWSGTMPAGGSDGFTIASSFDVDAMEAFYTELHDITSPIELLSNASGVCVITGDATYDYLVTLKDYEDY